MATEFGADQLGDGPVLGACGSGGTGACGGSGPGTVCNGGTGGRLVVSTTTAKDGMLSVHLLRKLPKLLLSSRLRLVLLQVVLRLMLLQVVLRRLKL